MKVTWEALTIDVRDPGVSAAWWAETLGWDVVAGDGGVEVRPPDGRGASLFFVAVDEVRGDGASAHGHVPHPCPTHDDDVRRTA